VQLDVAGEHRVLVGVTKKQASVSIPKSSTEHALLCAASFPQGRHQGHGTNLVMCSAIAK
jgi:hypothetical protein